jgi:hypothetical protein
MEMNHENRRFARYGVPAIIYAPELTGLCIVPIDISGGGFKAILDRDPELEGAATCEFHVFGEVFENCRIRVAWTEPIEAAPSSLLIGFEIEKFDGENRLQDAIEEMNHLMENR